jgi:4-hydroxy-tetrahydrodipicolinate reductase
MNIAIIGYGKMGKAVEKIAKQRGHTIKLKINIESKNIDYAGIDVAIDFSSPESAPELIQESLKNKVPTVSGTTGWLEKMPQIENLCQLNDTAFLYSSNFSIGMNLFFELNKQLNRLICSHKQYQASMTEIHHINKLDAPSGTALSLKEDIDSSFEIESVREGEVPGTHIINYNSEIDSIEIKHEAHNRNGFAFGAVLAAEWINNKKGIFSMNDVLNLK